MSLFIISVVLFFISLTICLTEYFILKGYKRRHGEFIKTIRHDIDKIDDK